MGCGGRMRGGCGGGRWKWRRWWWGEGQGLGVRDQISTNVHLSHLLWRIECKMADFVVWGREKITTGDTGGKSTSPPSFAENAKEGWGTLRYTLMVITRDLQSSWWKRFNTCGGCGAGRRGT